MTHFEMINLIKELKTLLELLRESLINLTTKPHAELDPKKNLRPHSNETEDPPPKKTNQTKTQPKQQAPGIPPSLQTQQFSTQKIGQHWKPTTNPHPLRSPWKKESNKHKPQISLIETENKFGLMETESQESPSKQRNAKYSKSLKIRSKSLETLEISESS